MLRPLKLMLPPMIAAGGLSSCAMAKSSVDLPHPDSPTMPRKSPWRISSCTWSTATTGPRSVAYATERSSTLSTGAPGATTCDSSARSSAGNAATQPPRRPERRVADLVEGVVEQRERCAQQRDADARRQRPQRYARLQRLVVLRPVQHRAPAQ